MNSHKIEAWEGETVAPAGFVGQHLPGYFDPINIKRKEAYADTLEELKSIEWIQWWLEHPEFYRLSVSRSCSLRHFTAHGCYITPMALMAEMRGGADWYVIAGLTKDYGLPDWKAK